MQSTSKIVFIFSFLTFLSSAQKVIASCSVSVSPNNVVMGVSNVSRFSVTNTGDQLGNWVRIESPNLTGYSIAQLNADSWYGSGGGTRGEFAGGYLEAGATGLFDLTLAETGEITNSMEWEALLSYDSGENFESCGTTTIQVVPAPVAPVISNISLTVGNNSAVISWSTNLTASGSVRYGDGDAYGSSSNSVSGTNHTVGISGLNPSTTYHYQIQSSSVGGTSSTNDATFTTSAASVSTTTTTTVTNTITQTQTETVNKIITDVTGPVIKMDTLVNPYSRKSVDQTTPIFESAPLITGSVSDDRGVAKVEFRIKGREESWSSANLEGETGAKKVAWELLPPLSLDGSYEIEVRGVDVFGNVSLIKNVKFVIDQQMPAISGGVISYGAIPLEAIDGEVVLIEGLEYEVVVHETGGADEVTIEIANLPAGKAGQKFSNTRMGNNGLWRGMIKLDEMGEFVSKVRALDGAGNMSEREWVKFRVLPRSRVLVDDREVENASITVYKLDPSTKVYQKWDSTEYGYSTRQLGFVLPKGDFYLQLEFDGQKIISQKLSLARTTNIVGDWEVGQAKWWQKVFKIRRLVNLTVTPWHSYTVSPDLQMGREKWIGKESIVFIGAPELPWYRESLKQAEAWAAREGAQIITLTKELNAGLLPQVYLVNDKGDTVDYKEGIWER